MQDRWPRHEDEWRNTVEHKLQQISTEFERAWKFLPQIPDPEIGIPFTGPLSPVPFVFPPTSADASGTATSGSAARLLCEPTHVCVTFTGVSGFGSPETLSAINTTHTLTRVTASPETVSGAGAECVYELAGQPFLKDASGNNQGIIRFVVSGGVARLQVGYATFYTYVVSYSVAVTGATTHPITIGNRILGGYASTGFPATVDVVDCSYEGTGTGDVIGSGSVVSGGCDCAGSFTFTISGLTVNEAMCDISALNGSWTITQTDPAACAWEVVGTNTDAFWTMYYSGGGLFYLTGYVWACGGIAVITMTSIDPCDDAMSFLTEDALFSTTLNPA